VSYGRQALNRERRHSRPRHYRHAQILGTAGAGIARDGSQADDVRHYAARRMSEKFHGLGDQVYVDAEKVKASNKAL
jgi:hypothetical protein